MSTKNGHFWIFTSANSRLFFSQLVGNALRLFDVLKKNVQIQGKFNRPRQN